MPGEYQKSELLRIDSSDVYSMTYTVDHAHATWRADKFLSLKARGKSRNQIQKAIDDRHVFLNGKYLKSSTILREGDQIQIISFPNSREPTVNLNHRIIYEDEYLVAIDKPAHLPVHPAGRFLFNTLLVNLRKSNPQQHYYLVHRLDRETSGVIVLAKQKSFAQNLTKQFTNRSTEKIYLAITRGKCKHNIFKSTLDIGPAQNSAVRLKMQAYPEGTGVKTNNPKILNCSTQFETIFHSAEKNRTLIKCILETGRQHQIRVHLSALGYPILGDKLYASDERFFLKYIETNTFDDEMHQELEVDRHALHSHYLKIYHEPLGRWISFESPLPSELSALI